MNASDQADESIAPRKLVQEPDIRQQLNDLFKWAQDAPGKELVRIRAVDQAIALISQTVSSVIGEDVKKRPGVGLYSWEVSLNQLRAEQTATAKRLLGREDI